MSISAPQNELIPRKITLTDAAKNQWILYHNAIDRDLGAGMRLVPIRRFANKAAEHVLRLSGIQAMVQCADVEQIGVEDMERGIMLVEYYLNEAMRIQGCLSILRDLLLAQKVLNWCKESGARGYCVTGDLSTGAISNKIRWQSTAHYGHIKNMDG